MITVIKQGNVYNRRVISLEGLSTDTKPVEYFIETDSNGVEVARVYIENGSTFTEIDTGKLFMYDAENNTWYEIETSGGGGSGGTTNYNLLSNKPKINDTELSGNKISSDLGLQDVISDLETIRSGAALGATAVQPEAGKGLSTNDYTTAEKTKLAGIAEGAEVNEIESIKVNNTTINPDANKVVNITVPTTAADVSALPDTTKYAAALSLTINSSTFVMTGQLKDQNGDNLGTAQTIDLPLESVVVGGSYNSQTQKVVLTLQNGNTVEFSVADLVSGLQTELSASNKLNPAYINYDSTHRAVSDTEKSTWNGKQDALTTFQLAAANSGIDSTKVEQIETNKNNILYNTNQGVKNFFNLTKVSGTYSTVVFTVNSDKTVTVNGTASPGNSIFDLDDWTCTKAGTYVISGAPSGGSWTPSPNTYRIRVAVNGAWKGDDVGNGYALTLAVGDVVNLQINTSTSYTANNLVFKPMICPKTIYDSDNSYQLYAMSNSELTAAIQALQAQLANQ